MTVTVKNRPPAPAGGARPGARQRLRPLFSLAARPGQAIDQQGRAPASQRGASPPRPPGRPPRCSSTPVFFPPSLSALAVFPPRCCLVPVFSRPFCFSPFCFSPSLSLPRSFLAVPLFPPPPDLLQTTSPHQSLRTCHPAGRNSAETLAVMRLQTTTPSHHGATWRAGTLYARVLSTSARAEPLGDL